MPTSRKTATLEGDPRGVEVVWFASASSTCHRCWSYNENATPPGPTSVISTVASPKISDNLLVVDKIISYIKVAGKSSDFSSPGVINFACNHR